MNFGYAKDSGKLMEPRKFVLAIAAAKHDPKFCEFSLLPRFTNKIF